MKITYVLELLKPTRSKSKIIEQNIMEVQKNRITIANKLKDEVSNLSSKDFLERIPSAVKNLNSWSFYELQQFIEYKARLSGIDLVYINPKYTSQTCSKCGVVDKSNRNRNNYNCNCGNDIHSDLNAARNICDIGIPFHVNGRGGCQC